MTEPNNWHIFFSNGKQTTTGHRQKWLDTAPPWRQSTPIGAAQDQSTLQASTSLALEEAMFEMSNRSKWRGKNYICQDESTLTRINMALMLRRPVLVTGPAGVGKSSLAYSIAWCLRLGEVLRWEINSQTTLKDGLYHYDAVGHLQAGQRGGNVPASEFIQLGPLGTALLPANLPRVLLIDELDKASFDLPNDLLHVLEEGGFEIPELVRSGSEKSQVIRLWSPPSHQSGEGAGSACFNAKGGRILAHHYPVVVITSNKERKFSEAFMRRCVPLELKRPGDETIREIVRALFDEAVEDNRIPADDHVTAVLERYSHEMTDVVLQALFLETRFKADSDDIETALRRRDQ